MSNGQPAAVIGSFHTCPKTTGNVPHVGGPVVTGSPDVFIGGLPAARVGDTLICIGPPDTINEGSPSVFINGKPAARVGDGTAHGGVLTHGNGTVLIGNGGGVKIGSGTVTAGTSGKVVAGKGVVIGGGVSSKAATTAASSLSTTTPSPPILIQQAITATNSKGPTALSEAVGELGLATYKHNSGISDAPGFIKRYHGPDTLGVTAAAALIGMEAKGSATGVGQINMQKGGCIQVSREANAKRADGMLRKKREGKVGQPSNRIGGPYTGAEMDLYQEVEDMDGEKELVSVHTHTETGKVTVLQHNGKGKVIGTSSFQLENFAEQKAQLAALLEQKA